jgi:hypothetical protein
MGNRTLVAASGYSAPPAGYAEFAGSFMRSFSKAAGSARTGFLTSPTADPGSIDAITTVAAQTTKSKIGYITADHYLKYVKPENFAPEVDRAAFAQTPKYSFPDADTYSRATGQLSNAGLTLGGRNVAVSDWMNGVRNGNRMAVVGLPIGNSAWDPAKGRVDNASLYLQKMVAGDHEGIDMTNPFNQEVSRFIVENKAAVTAQVRFFAGKPRDAGAKAAQWLVEGR